MYKDEQQMMAAATGCDVEVGRFNNDKGWLISNKAGKIAIYYKGDLLTVTNYEGARQWAASMIKVGAARFDYLDPDIFEEILTGGKL